jgi:predicted dehydrogenase
LNQKKLNVAIVRLGLGKGFIPIYQRHPNTNMYALCQRTPDKLNEISEQYDVTELYEQFEELV